MKIKKLNSRGFSHGIVLALFVVIFAIGGVGYIVASHAADCGTSVSGVVTNPVTSPATAPVTPETCAPVSQTVTAPVTPITTPPPPPVKGLATCTITNVPATALAGQKVNPTVTITNTGTVPISPAMVSFAATNGATSYFKEVTFGQIAPGLSLAMSLGDYPMPTVAGSVQFYTHSDVNYPGTKDADFNCTATSKVSTLALGSCIIKSVPTVRPNQTIAPVLQIHNMGNISFRPIITETTTYGRTLQRKTITANSVPPHAYSSYISLPSYLYRKTSGVSGYVTFTATNINPNFTCTTKTRLL